MSWKKCLFNLATNKRSSVEAEQLPLCHRGEPRRYKSGHETRESEDKSENPVVPWVTSRGLCLFPSCHQIQKKKNLTSLKTFWEKWNQNQCRHVHCKFRNKMRKWIAEQSTSTTGMNLLMWHNEFWEVPGSSVNRILIKGVETWLKNSMNKTKEKTKQNKNTLTSILVQLFSPTYNWIFYHLTLGVSKRTTDTRCL